MMLEQNTMLTDCLEDSTSQGLFASLIDVLKKELAIYRELKAFLTEEKKILLQSPSLAQINDNNARKENIILKARILEEGRNNVLKKIARNLDIDDRSIKLMSLANYAVIEQRQAIDQIKEELLGIAGDIRELNGENQYILDVSLGSIKGSLELISSLVNRSGGYLGNGTMKETGRNGRLLRTEG